VAELLVPVAGSAAAVSSAAAGPGIDGRQRRQQ